MFQHFLVKLLLDRLAVLVFAPIPHPEPLTRKHFLKRVLRAVDGYFFLHFRAHFHPPQISSSGTTNVHSRVLISSPRSLLAGCWIQASFPPEVSPEFWSTTEIENVSLLFASLRK